MARQLRSFYLFLFVSSIMFVSSIQARSLSILEGGINCNSGNVVYANNLALAAVKSGPSPRGIGHLSVVTDVIGGKKSGPSRRGVGHFYVNGIGGKKISGPSPGKGH
ncbi:hypothetical protein MKW98_021816 [Papaver atlanticum]|uniref:Uncharacterized protein n=1 Tax=Papaver atlanticum TaxID=357466 RepID=A0AAD4X899_9MAGN|nr:hypothetical protein MKW98_021816 [Papaver atlanticum]